MLYGFALGVQGHHALCGHAFIQRGQAGPQQKAAKAHGQHQQPGAGYRARVR